MTPKEYEELSRPILNVIDDIKRRHEQELKPFWDRLYELNSLYTPPILVPVDVREKLQLQQGIRCGSIGDTTR